MLWCADGLLRTRSKEGGLVAERKGRESWKRGPGCPWSGRNPPEYHPAEFPGPRHLCHRYKATRGAWRISRLIVGGRASNWGQTSWANRSNNCQVPHGGEAEAVTGPRGEWSVIPRGGESRSLGPDASDRTASQSFRPLHQPFVSLGIYFLVTLFLCFPT